ncbi:bifunctional lysylphosphatidylglycerol flippase/synthetase MprF [Pseudonocardia sp. MH-G8]|uniref:bifunctional lysylphosphatidylglycerol flippase/synthetase MprF n=1 Tax=Pseudonocardia sp. MH-G8 TaxID=1854588 RepID=UPI0018E95DE0|nr:DUF2156 domain-containing protein [Pseudonocardia sp. MH-G8]
MRQAPMTLGLIVVLWLCGAVTGSLLHGPSPQLQAVVGVGVSSLGAGRWWTLLTGGLWCANLVSYLASSVVLLVLVAPVEARIGARRTSVLLVSTHLVAAVVAAGLVRAGAAAGDGWSQQLATDVAVGPIPAAVGAVLAASRCWGALWRRRARVLVLAALVMGVLYSGTLQDVLRLSGGLAGLALPAVIGLFLAGTSRGRRRGGPRLAVTGRETRVLVALVVAASAVGPVVAAMSGTATGPLWALRFLVLTPPPEPDVLQAVCATPAVVEDCADLQARLRLGGLGPAVLTVLPVVLLLVLAEGLRRGRRFAWWGAVGLNLLFAAVAGTLAVFTSAVPAERLVAFGDGGGAAFPVALVAAVVQPLLVVALLALTRRRFVVPAPTGLIHRWAATVGMALLTASVVYLGGGVLARGEFAPAPGWPELLADLPTRFLPPGYLGQLEIGFLPVGWAATVLYEWTGVLFWAVAVTATVRVLRADPRVPDNAERARTLLQRHGGSSLSYLGMWPGNSYWLDPGGRAAIAFRVIGPVALSTGEPFGAPAARGRAVAGFARFCAEHGWTPCLYSVGDDTRAHAQDLGWSAVQVAEETMVPLPELAFTGRKWQDVRTALNKAGKAGITAEWITYSRAPLVLTDQIRAISEDWVADKGLPEMGFTLGGLDELADPAVRCLIAVDADRTVHGITSWLPVYGGDGAVVGWTLDFMRRRDRGFGPVMEFLIASAALRLQEEGAAYLSLSAAPLARLGRDEPSERSELLQRVLDRLGRVLEPVYGFGSLLAFKAKFQPEYRPLYLAYPDPAALPAIATAVGRAYLPDLGPVRALALLRRLRQLHRSLPPHRARSDRADARQHSRGGPISSPAPEREQPRDLNPGSVHDNGREPGGQNARTRTRSPAPGGGR